MWVITFIGVGSEEPLRRGRIGACACGRVTASHRHYRSGRSRGSSNSSRRRSEPVLVEMDILFPAASGKVAAVAAVGIGGWLRSPWWRRSWRASVAAADRLATWRNHRLGGRVLLPDQLLGGRWASDCTSQGWSFAVLGPRPTRWKSTEIRLLLLLLLHIDPAAKCSAISSRNRNCFFFRMICCRWEQLRVVQSYFDRLWRSNRFVIVLQHGRRNAAAD